MKKKFKLLALEEQDALRREALQAVMNGENKSQVAQRIGVTRQAVHRWVHNYGAGGPESLRSRPRGRRRVRPLEPWQEELLHRAILGRPAGRPDRQPSTWTKRAIAEFSEERFGVRLPEWIVTSYLREWGFASQRELRHVVDGSPGRVCTAHEEPVRAPGPGPAPGSGPFMGS